MSHENPSRRALFLAGASASVVALPAVAAALPAPAAPVEAAVDLPDAVAPKTDDELIALDERLKAMMPRMAALKRKSHVLWEEARACLPDGWGRDSDHYRTFKSGLRRMATAKSATCETQSTMNCSILPALFLIVLNSLIFAGGFVGSFVMMLPLDLQPNLTEQSGIKIGCPRRLVFRQLPTAAAWQYWPRSAAPHRA
jgi:hypothetical protein